MTDQTDLLTRLLNQHRPRLDPDPFVADGIRQFLASCPACDSNRHQLVNLDRGDTVPACAFWQEGLALGLVADTPPPTD